MCRCVLMIRRACLRSCCVFGADGNHLASQVEQEMQCPFYSGGLFVTEERSECADPFMEVAPRQLPGCDGHCCRLQHSSGAAAPLNLDHCIMHAWTVAHDGNHILWVAHRLRHSAADNMIWQVDLFCKPCLDFYRAGAFLKKATETQPHQLQFQPGGGDPCRFQEYSRAEVLAALQGSDAAEGPHPGMDILVRYSRAILRSDWLSHLAICSGSVVMT